MTYVDDKTTNIIILNKTFHLSECCTVLCVKHMHAALQICVQDPSPGCIDVHENVKLGYIA